ncbi:MAG TPA: hypothetical protein VH413_16300 [Verrucomicrobiae bacterium]|jgi:hypothetical protein|nr:hypothetical protein [Verrucomicrobiae bacterium]
MKYTLPAVQTADLDTIQSPYFGGEFAVYMTNVPGVRIGQVDLTATAQGTYTADPATTIQAAGSDLQMVAITPINSAAQTVVTLSGTDTSEPPVPITLTATFAPPARSLNQTFNFARSFAVDMVVGPVSVPASTFRSRASNVATLTIPAHKLLTGMKVNVTGVGGTGYNENGVTVTVLTPNTFTYPSTGADEATAADTGAMIAVINNGLAGTITGLISVTGGSANMSFRVYQLPVLADYVLISPTMEIDFNTRSRVAKGINSGMETDAFIKSGMSQPGELSIGSNLVDFEAGMARFDGQKTTCMLIGLKDGQLQGDRIVFQQYHGTVKPKLPTGDGEATIEAAGKFADLLIFFAP